MSSNTNPVRFLDTISLFNSLTLTSIRYRLSTLVFDTDISHSQSYLANNIEFLGELDPDVGRLTNKMWCYITSDISKAEKWIPEREIKIVKYPFHKIGALIQNKQFNHALNLAVLYLAELKGISIQKK